MFDGCGNYVNADAYWDGYQERHDPQWYDAEEQDVIDDVFEDCSDEWESADYAFEESRLGTR